MKTALEQSIKEKIKALAKERDNICRALEKSYFGKVSTSLSAFLPKRKVHIEGWDSPGKIYPDWKRNSGS